MRNRLTIPLAIIFAIVLLLQFTMIYGFQDWTFITGNFAIANKLILYFSSLGLILCLATLAKTPRWLRISIGILFAIFFVINAFFEFNPIDTTTEPNDKEVLSTSFDGKKLIVRQRTNAKTKTKILDTVLVKDFGIFRHIFSK